MRISSLVVIVVILSGDAATAGVFRKDEDFHAIKDFGAIKLINGRLLIGKEGRSICVPAATQFRVDQGPYLTYDPEGKNSTVNSATETNLKATWHFVVETKGSLPRGSGSHGQRYTKITEIRVQTMIGPYKDWYIGVDRAAMKAALEEAARTPSGKGDKQPQLWPLILVKAPADALLFIHRVSGTYHSK